MSRSFSLVDRTLQRVHRDGEAVAVVEARGRDLVLRATSAPRFARLLDRLEQLAGARIDAGVAEVVGPWEHDPGLVEQEDASTVRCTMTLSLPMDVARREHAALATVDFFRRSLNEHIPALEGTPSELVKSDEGRPKVEQWLREAELSGHSDPSSAYLDLDPLRCELGLPPVGPAPAAPRLEELPKMSATLIEFAQPLLDELSTADDIEMLRRVMTIATLVWNLPVYERRNAPEAPACRAAFEDAMAQAPRPIAKHLDAMARARLTMYAHDPRLAFVEVADQGNGRANIQATAVVFPHGG